ncbi:MAG: mandelate racemase/muconate lactonizing enzyme family protein [Hyphomicrobiaceae bacterium]
MKLVAIETIRSRAHPNLLWVELITDEGLVGLGETFYGPGAAEAHIHETIAPYLLGEDPLQIARHQARLTGYVGFVGASAEMRGRSAVDIALWDLLGQATGKPICDLLGGRARERVRVYNTCAGNSYVQTRPMQGTDNFGLSAGDGDYEDLEAFLGRADELAHSLLEMGITAMKIWPFDYAAEASQGQWIGVEDLNRGLEPFEKIRVAVGDRMEIAAELHGLWSRPMAVKIARALEDYRPMWVEDPVFLDHLDSLRDVAAQTTCPIAVGETRGGLSDFRTLCELDALSMVICDLSWCGGVSLARDISTLTRAHHVPVAFHDCTGPVVLTASTHMALHAENCWVQEIVRAFYFGWYGQYVTELPPIDSGTITVPVGAGLGTQLQPDVKRREAVTVRRTALSDV